jgi:hypothetical protein
MTRPRIAVLAANGRSVQDWILGGFLPSLDEMGAEAMVLSPNAEALARGAGHAGTAYERIEIAPLSRRRRDLAAAMDLAHAFRLDTYVHRSLRNLTFSDWPWKAKVYHALIKCVGRAMAFPPLYDRQEAIERAFLGLGAESRRIQAALTAWKPDLVFSTLPLIAHYERPTLWAARRLGIPTVGGITSWDNLHSKGRRPIPFDHYLVWSEWMRGHLLEIHPDIAPEAVSVIGAPQFDLYFRADMRKSREAFLKSIGGDAGRRLILWSGASTNQFPNEPAVIEHFCTAAREGKLLGNPQILVRPHPIGGGARYAELRRRFPEVLFTETNASDPVYCLGWLPLQEDAAVLVNSVLHCDVNINHCSTMTLDCCTQDRPVVNIAFDLEPGSEMEHYLRNCYRYEHYRPVLDLGAVRLANTLEELLGAVNSYLEDPSLDREGREALVRLHCGAADGQAASRAAGTLMGLARRFFGASRGRMGRTSSPS